MVDGEAGRVLDARGRIVRDPFARDEEFRRLIRGEKDVDLVRVNLEVARDAYPDLDEAQILCRIDAIADRVRERCSPDGGTRYMIGQINWVLFVEEGFRGNVDNYYDPRNSYLNEVLDRKLGLPITLSILYARVADRAGLALGCVNLPMHFALKVLGREEPLIVDPFHEGRVLDRPGCERFLSDLTGRAVQLGSEDLDSCDPSATVARMLRNLKAVYLERQDFGSALPVVRRLAALRRDDLQEQRDWGMICLQADRPGEALDPLGRYVEAMPQAPDVEAVRSLLKSARREIACRN
jgi:regulator of sirC expression with transglutaminase-like and TPR domain